MANPIKYSTGSESLALKKGDFYIGTGDVGKGPSNTTGYYNGITPPSGGYTIYIYKSGQPGDLSYHTASNDTELISFTNNLAGTSYTTANECLTYFASQTDKVCFNRDYEGIVTDGLMINFDPSFTPSYPKNGTTVYDISNTNNGTLVNGVGYGLSNGGVFTFDGTDDYISTSSTSIFFKPDNISLNVWFEVNTETDYWGLFGRYNNLFTEGVVLYGYLNNLRFTINTYNTNYVEYDISYNTLYNVQCTYDKTNLKLYINGSLVDTVTFSDSIIYSNSFLWDVGFEPDSRYRFNGNLYYASAYNRALTESEVLQNYNAQKDRFGL